MQALFPPSLYAEIMAAKSKLRHLRESAGLSVRELARQIGETHTNVSYWERSGQIPRSDVLAPIAKALAVPVEELLGVGKARRTATPGGKLGQVFEQVSKLPRRQQEKIIEVVQALVTQQTGKTA